MTRIIVFAKAPVPGQVKTRLIPVLGEEGAAALAERMMFDTCREALAAGVGPVELCLSGMLERVPPGVELSDQGQGDLGERLDRAAARGIGGGGPVLLIGTDCPELGSHRLRTAADALRDRDCVIYPALDGGYALLGLRRFDPSIFAGIAWSTPTVAAETCARIEALGWSLHIGDSLRDLDEPADLAAAGIILSPLY